MRYRMLDVNGDYSFGSGQQNFTYGSYAVAQAINTRLAFLKGEWWEDLEIGLPLFQNILGQQGTPDNIEIVDLLIKQTIADTQDVTEIKNFDSSYENRIYIFSCTVITKYGEITVSSTV